jgi:hypothetical protein
MYSKYPIIPIIPIECLEFKTKLPREKTLQQFMMQPNQPQVQFFFPNNFFYYDFIILFHFIFMHSFLDMLNHLDGMDRVKKRTFPLLEFRIRGDLLGF